MSMPFFTDRACLDQLLIAIRQSLIVCNHVQSKRLIAIVSLIAKLRTIYTTWLHNGILNIVSLLLHSACMYRLTNTAQGEREGG